MKEDWVKKIGALEHQPHCSNCGTVNPEFLPYGDDTQDGFTACCQHGLCRGEKLYKFGNDDVECEACCWAVAEVKFNALGVDIFKQSKMRRYL